MKIDGNNIGGAAPAGAQETAGAESARKAARLGYRSPVDSSPVANHEPGTDEVALSDLGQTLSRLAQTEAGREARIGQLEAAYAQGTLDADPQIAARKLVDDAFHNE
jgi:anti-sigma28 factor (negative regulator of flagellin synthesis)